jgi:hypothetical protein
MVMDMKVMVVYTFYMFYRVRLLAPRLAACNIVGHTPGVEPKYVIGINNF